jgi:hypothetical protein
VNFGRKRSCHSLRRAALLLSAASAICSIRTIVLPTNEEFYVRRAIAIPKERDSGSQTHVQIVLYFPSRFVSSLFKLPTRLPTMAAWSAVRYCATPCITLTARIPKQKSAPCYCGLMRCLAKASRRSRPRTWEGVASGGEGCVEESV